MRSLRYYFRFFYAFVSKFKGLLILSGIVGIIAFILFNLFAPVFFKGRTQRIGMVGRYHTDNLPIGILNQIGDGLTKIEPDGTVSPNLASSWESPDKGKTWIFTLKDGYLWQDGDKLTSKTVVYEFTDVEIEKPDEKTIVFTLKDPFAPFPSVVSKPTFKKGLLGTGEWSVNKVTLSGSYIENLTLVDKQQNKRIYKFYPTEENAKLAYTQGQIDIISDLFDASPISTWKTANVETDVSKNKIVTVFFNVNDRILSDKSLRQALIYAINKKGLPGDRAIGPISPSSWVFNPLVKPYDFSLDRAKEILDDLPEEQTKDLKLTLVSTPFLLQTAEQVANYWRELGIDVTVLVSSIVPTQFQAYLTMIDVPTDPDQYSLWHSTRASENISGYANPRIDKLLEDGRTELNLEERRKIYLDFQRFLVEDSPAAFLYHPETYTITRK